MSDDLDIPFDRITYRDGQLLTALDLRGDRRRDERLRRLHTRHVHDTWGIALGLVVTTANKGEAVEISPGYAVDIDGRDILLAETVQLAVPEVGNPEAFVLTAGYQEDGVFRERSDLTGLCLSGRFDPRHERPVFSWRRPDDVRFGPEVPLVQVVAARGKILNGLDFRVRRNARPMVRPHMGWGTTEPGQTGWRRWQEEGHSDLGIEVVVDTSEAGFTEIPHYLASLEGDFGNQTRPEARPPDTQAAFFLEGLTFMTDVRPESFTFRVIRVALPLVEVPVSGAQAERRQWTVSWLGLEPVTGCEPRRDPKRIFSLSGIQIAARD